MYIKKSFVYTLVIVFIFLGFIGLAIPIVPQTIFFVIALILISFEIPAVGNRVETFLAKYPEALRLYKKHRDFLEKHLK